VCLPHPKIQKKANKINKKVPIFRNINIISDNLIMWSQLGDTRELGKSVVNEVVEWRGRGKETILLQARVFLRITISVA